MAAVKRPSVLHFSLVYIFWHFVTTESLPGFLETDMKVTDGT